MRLPHFGFPQRTPAVFGPADQLGHGSHGTVDAPGAGFAEDHGYQAQHRGGKHYAVKTEGELGDPGGRAAVVGPLPGQAEGPQQSHYLPQILRAGEYQSGGEEHLAKHHQEKDEKAVAEPAAFHPGGDVPPAGKTKAPAQQGKELPAAAVAVAVPLGAAGNGNDQWDQEARQAQPGEENVEKSQTQIRQGDDPEIIVPVFFHFAASSHVMTLAGHSRTHLPQPMQRARLTRAVMPRRI